MGSCFVCRMVSWWRQSVCLACRTLPEEAHDCPFDLLLSTQPYLRNVSGDAGNVSYSTYFKRKRWASAAAAEQLKYSPSER